MKIRESIRKHWPEEYNPFLQHLLLCLILLMTFEIIKVDVFRLITEKEIGQNLISLVLNLSYLTAVVLIFLKKKAGLAVWGLAFVFSLLLQIFGQETSDEIVFFKLAVFLFFNFALAAFLCLRKDGKSAWKVLFEKK